MLFNIIKELLYEYQMFILTCITKADNAQHHAKQPRHHTRQYYGLDIARIVLFHKGRAPLPLAHLKGADLGASLLLVGLERCATAAWRDCLS